MLRQQISVERCSIVEYRYRHAGKTYTIFQIIYRLWKAKKAKRILFLVDRNILADQTLVNDFKPFGSVMTKIRNRKIDPSYEIYLGLYQALTGPDEEDKIFKSVKRDFFDLIVIDECHRGSANDDSAWKEILEYFDGAIQLGMTATPKETKYASNITYFGEPIYTYSLKQGIQDGFLAPYKVVRIDIAKDINAAERDRPDAKRWKDIWSAGHAVSGVTDVPSVADLVARTEAEYRAARAGR